MKLPQNGEVTDKTQLNLKKGGGVMSNDYVVADPIVCIGCQTCMAACLSKHDMKNDIAKPRLNVVSTRAISTPVLCRHCEDALCAAACPTGALYMDNTNKRVAVNPENCIGCLNCVTSCPYGAVKTMPKVTQLKIGKVVVHEDTRTMVVKCDLCWDREDGPACVSACPTGGLVFVHKPEDKVAVGW